MSDSGGSAGPPVAEVIALDGPAGSGKSTVARLVAKRLGLAELDTGAMYRAVTFAALQAGVSLDDGDAVGAVARRALIDMDRGRVVVDGIDATKAIRGPEVTAGVSAVASSSEVRQVLVERQRDWLRSVGSGVLEGRDIGSVVFPGARLKVYLDARPEVRAQRRAAQTGEDHGAVLAAIVERDRADSSRQDSPLRADEGAVVIDTSELTLDQVVDAVVDRWRLAGGGS